MRNLFRILSSPVLAVILLLSFAVSMATATFIENDFGTATAWKLVYNSTWFELIMLGLCLCFTANIFKYRLFQRKKWPVLLFHVAFIVIIAGAAITRYTASSGIMRIREGDASSTLISSDKYLKIHLSKGDAHAAFKKRVELSPLADNQFQWSTVFEGERLDFNLDKFIADASVEITEDTEKGHPLLEMVITRGQGRETLLLAKGEVEDLGEHNHRIGFESDEDDIINITEKNGEFSIKTPEPLDYFVMADQRAGKLDESGEHQIQLRTLFRSEDISFVPLNYYENGRFEMISTSKKPGDNEKEKDDALIVSVSSTDQTKEVNLLYREGFVPTRHEASIDDINIELSYGSEAVELPFSIYLDDFQLERYPGSSSPSSYASEVIIKDKNLNTPYRIFMNNVLDYRGYRFYQASYDTDERGTVLSVNRDRPGTYITYTGYLLMGIGMFLALFGKGSHYSRVNKKLKQIQSKKEKGLIMLLLFFFSISSYTLHSQEIPPSVKFVAREQADEFGRLLVQDLDGRIKPVNSLASEFIRKVSRRNYFRLEEKDGSVTLDPDQVFLSMMMAPSTWQRVPVIKIDPDKLNALGLSKKYSKDHVSFNELLDENGAYLLSEAVERSNLKKPSERDEADKEVLQVDERFNILYNVLSGKYLKIFPNKNDDNQTWFSYTHDFKDFPEEDAHFARNIIPAFFNDLSRDNRAEAHEKLQYISTYQRVLGATVIPDESHVNAELLYNELNINFWMFQILFTLGFLLLIFAMIRIFYHSGLIDILWNIFVIITLIAFLFLTGNLILRWYVAGHAPWSNGYEMLVFVSWVLLLCGLLVFRKSDFALPLTSLFSGALLFVSYLDWINPEITNLMPVLKSYWLKVHVATIVSSYAPLALSAILGFMALLLLLIRTKTTSAAIDLRIKELTYINEISMTIGLFVLSVGTFLGGVWANESWGRYWAWDPKETWALISIIIYAVVLHLRLIPRLNNIFILNTASMFAFWSIIMTSFGVNYFLSGLHSYAAGDPMPIPKFVYVLAGIMILLTVLVWFKNKEQLSASPETSDSEGL